MKKLYTSTVCPYCDKVKNYINTNKISGIEIVNISESIEDRDYLIENGGKLQVPCLYADNKYIYESNDIVKYLQENF